MGDRILLLNGASSSGKSTLAYNLQKIIKYKKNYEYGVVSIDDFLKMKTDEKIYEDDVYEISSKLCRKSIEILDSKEGIIIDYVITSERIFNQLIDTFKQYDIYLIQVTCPLEKLIERERQRKDRCIGSAEESYRYLFPKEGYYLTVDTSQSSMEECALKIIDAIVS